MSATETIELNVVDAAGKKVGSKKVAAEVFAAEVNKNLLHQVVRWQRAKKRAGTHSVKTRSQVRGGGAKPWRQKGTGRARAGSSSSPIWVGGGVAHGPKVRSYEFSLNKKEKTKATCSALSARNADGKLLVLKSFDLEEIKTKAANQVLNAIGIESGKKAVVVLPEGEQTVEKSLRNLSGVKALVPGGVNVYDLINAEYVVILDEALEPVEQRFTN